MNILNLDLQKTLTLEEIQHLFSMTDELSAKQVEENIEVSLRVTTKVEYQEAFKPIYTYEYIKALTYQPTLQTLIRQLISLGYRNHIGHAQRNKENYSLLEK